MKYADRVKDTTSTTGTVTITLSGSAPTGYRAFSVFSSGQANIPYLIDDGAGNWESGIGTYTTNALARNAVFASSNSGAKVSFPSGTKTVICTLPASVMQMASTDPDDVGFDIIIIAGQSNAMGAGYRDTRIDVANPRVWQYGCDTSDTGSYGKIIQAIDPLAFQGNYQGTYVGASTWMARAYCSSVPAHRHVLLVPVAQGSTALVGGEWSYPSGSLYLYTITQANAAIAAAMALYPSSRVVGVFWVQGEAESAMSTTAAAYKAAWIAMMDGWKAAISGASGMLAVIGSMTPEILTDSGVHPNASVIWGAHEALPSEYPNTVFVEGPSGLNSGLYHYTAEGYRILGSRMGIAIKSARLGLSYSATATAPGAPIIGTATAGNAQATVTFTTPSSNGGSAITSYTAISSPGSFTASGSASPLTVTGLTNGTSYTFTVTATNAIGTGPASSASNSVTPAVATAPAQVTGLTLGTATSTTQPLSWSVPSNGGSAITDYVIQWSPVGANTWTTFSDGTSTTAATTVTGLTASTSYDYRVAAVNAIGQGSYSSTSTGSTSSGSASYTTWNPSDKDSGITLSNGNLTAAGASWVAVRALGGKTSGKWYAELEINVNDPIFGVGTAAAGLGMFPGSDGESCGLRATNGHIYGITTSDLAMLNPGDRMAVEVNKDDNTIAWRQRSGGTWGSWSSDLPLPSACASAAVYLIISPGSGNSTLHSDPANWLGSPRAGVSAWTQ